MWETTSPTLKNLNFFHYEILYHHSVLHPFCFGSVNIVEFPTEKYSLWLAMTVSGRYPDYVIDDIGVQPDFYIDEGISPEYWVGYVQAVIETG